MKAFEIYTFRGGNWKIDSVFDDKDLALFEAKRMDSSNRFPSVRVVEEIFDEVSSQTSTRTIFRGGSDAEQSYRAPKKAAPAINKARPRAAGAERSPTGRRRKPAKKKSGFSGPFLILLLVVVFGFAAMFGLQFFAGVKLG